MRSGQARAVRRLISFLARSLHLLYLYTSMFAKSAPYHAYIHKALGRQPYGLNLGCGRTKIENFCNMDANPRARCDILARADKIKLRSDSVTTIYSSHVFEHIPRAKAKEVLAEWYRVLKPEGKLYICVPDSEVLFRVYLDNLPLYSDEEGKYLVDRSCYIVYGGQMDSYDYHFYGYSFVTLKCLLESVGFRDVQRFDHGESPIVLFFDISMVKIKDIPMSLNMVASKGGHANSAV